jgi:hypothetical protein
MAAIRVNSHIPLAGFYVGLGSPVLSVVALSARGSSWRDLAAPTQLPKANQFLAYFSLLAGPDALSRPTTAQISLPSSPPPPSAPGPNPVDRWVADATAIPFPMGLDLWYEFIEMV